jgi:hypothetical protein
VKIQPRQLILELWRATAAYSFQNGEWLPGGITPENSISDAEQLLCLMYPASEIQGLRLDRPDRTAEDVLDALRPLGDAVEIPKVLIRAIAAYMERYQTKSGAPTFGGGSYFLPREPTDELKPEQRQLDVVDSFSMSVTLSLATLGFLKEFRRAVRRRQLMEEVDRLEAAASRRLTAAMAGLLRSFTVHAFPPDSDAGIRLCRTANQGRLPTSEIVSELRRSLVQVRAGLLDAMLGSGGAEVLDNDSHLFECGWSWGVVKGALPIRTEDAIEQPQGIAQARPLLYFTAVALDGIADLFFERTRVLGLLNPEQQILARDLQIRWELTQQYWAAIARFGTFRWPLEDIPWQTTYGSESDYYSLLVTSVLVSDLERRRGIDVDLARVAGVLEELAIRGRVTRRPLLGEDTAVEMHVPGMRFDLYGIEELGTDTIWPVTDFATALLKQTARIAGMARNTELRDRLLALSDDIWNHISRRRFTGGRAAGLWDQPGGAFPSLDPGEDRPSWYFTERTSECLVVLAAMVDDKPLRNDRLVATARDLLNEADHLFNKELLAGSPASGMAMRTSLEQLGGRLERAREIIEERPGSAMAVLYEILQGLDRLATARRDVIRTD